MDNIETIYNADETSRYSVYETTSRTIGFMFDNKNYLISIYPCKKDWLEYNTLNISDLSEEQLQEIEQIAKKELEFMVNSLIEQVETEENDND